MKKCMYCGQENEDSSVVCAKCGNALLDIPTDQMPPLEETHDEEPVPVQGAGPVISDEQNASSEDVSSPGAAPSADTAAAGADYAQSAAGEGMSDPGTGYPPNGMGYPGAGYPGAGYPGAGYPQNGAGYPGAGYPGAGYPGAGYPQDGAGYPGAGYAQNGAGYPGAGYPQGEQGYAGAAYGYSQQPVRPGEEETSGYDEDDDDLPSPMMMEKARKMVHSPLFFLAALFYSVYVIGSIVYAVTGSWLTNLSTLSNTIKAFNGENIVLGYFDRGIVWLQTQDAANVILSRVVSGLSYLPAVLIMIGLWMAFTGISAKKEEVHTAGLTLMRVLLIIQFIFVCILLLAGIGVCVAYVVAAGAAQTMMTLIVGVIALLVMVIVTVLTILFFIQLLFSIRAVRTNCRTGIDIGRIPGFVIFIGFMSCLVAVAGVLMMAPDDYIGLVSGGAQAAWLLMISIWAIVYRAVVKPR